MLPVILALGALGGFLLLRKKPATAASAPQLLPSTSMPLPPTVASPPAILDAHLPPKTKALVQKAATQGKNPASLIKAAQNLLPVAPLAAQALANRAKAISPPAAMASQAVKSAVAPMPMPMGPAPIMAPIMAPGVHMPMPAPPPPPPPGPIPIAVAPPPPPAPTNGGRPAQYLSVPTGVAPMATITADQVALRDTPGGTLRTRMPKGARVGFYGTQGTWSHLEYAGYDGWASSQYVQPDAAASSSSSGDYYPGKG